MVTSRTRTSQLARPLFRMAPKLRLDVRILSRAQATAWDCPRRIITVRSTSNRVGVAWFENHVWQIGHLLDDGTDVTLSSTRVVAETYFAAVTLANLFRRQPSPGQSRSKAIDRGFSLSPSACLRMSLPGWVQASRAPTMT